MTESEVTEKRVVVIDGVCNFCNGAARFIIKHDLESKFVFTQMQSDYARERIQQYDVTNVGFDTFLLIKDRKSYIWTNAALEIASELNGFWFLLGVFRVVPRPIRDYFYRLFARNRYAIFGRTEVCQVPSENICKRFVGL